MDYYIPEETAKILRQSVDGCKNLGLLLDKYIPISALEKPDKDDKDKGKTPWLSNILKPTSAPDKTQNRHINYDLAQNAFQRWLVMTRAIGATHFSATLDWRMVVGLGGETVLETDLTLHHLYGIPYIPGSALKGLTRGYVTGEIGGYKSSKIEDDNEEIKRIFGSQEHAGTVIFFDAMPLDGKAQFALDIMNPHYPDYYGKGAAPSNDQSPNPITFLTVANTTFVFALVPRRPGNQKHVADVKQAEIWLQEALQKYGIGGKTSAGYGYFQQASDVDLTAPQPKPAQASQTPPAQTPTPAAQAQENWKRPNIKQFREGEPLQNCTVIESTEAMRQSYPKANAFLRYGELSAKYAYIVIDETFSEAQTWKPKESKGCIFIREERHGDSLVLICKPKPPKTK